MWTNFLWIGIGGAGGSMLRYLLQRAWNGSFPFGTTLVNLAGCMLIGLFWGWLQGEEDETGRLLLMTGFCGGFTTFSAFTLESIQLLQQSRWAAWMAYAGFNIVGGLALTFLGMKISS